MPIEQFIKVKKQELLNKYAKFFAADKKEARTAFQGIRYEEDGTAYASNTHILLRMKDVSPFAEPHTLHAITGAELEGTYPSQESIEKLLTWGSKNQIILESTEQIEKVTRYTKITQLIAKEMKAELKSVNLALSNENAYLEVKSRGAAFSAPIGNPEKHQSETWTFNADYLYNALSLFKDAKTSSLAIKFGSSRVNPICLTDEENGIDVLILPIQTV